MAELTPWLVQKFYEADGVTPAAGAKIFTYEAGTTTKKQTLQSQSGSANTNPIIADANGQADIWLEAGAYKIIQAPATDTDPPTSPIKTWDDINQDSTDGDSGIVDTIAELKGLSEGQFEVVQVLGFASVSDKASGVYRWDSTSALADNGLTVIQPTVSDGTGRWIRIYQEDYKPVTITELKALPAGGLSFVFAGGFDAVNDSMVAMYYWDSASTTADDGLNVIQPDTTPASGRWIRQYQSGYVADNVTTLKALPEDCADYVWLASHTTMGDGGEGWFRWDSTSTATDNNGTIITPTTSDGTGRWLRQYSGALNILWFGVDNTGSTDATAIIQTAIDLIPALDATTKIGGGVLYFPAGSYKTIAGLTLNNSGVEIHGESSKSTTILCTPDSASVTSITYVDVVDNDVSTGRFTMKNIAIRANSTDANTTGIGVDVTGMYACNWESVEFYDFPENLKLQNCYSTLFAACHHFGSAAVSTSVAITTDAACVSLTFQGGTIRNSSVLDAGQGSHFTGMDFEPQKAGATTTFGSLSTIENCYFEPALVADVPVIHLNGNVIRFENNILAWSVAARPDTWLIRVSGTQNIIRRLTTSYFQKVIKLDTTSQANNIEVSAFNLPVASGLDEYAVQTILDLGDGNEIRYMDSDTGNVTIDHGFINNKTTVSSGQEFTNLVGIPANHNLSALTSAKTTVITDPFGGDNVYLDTMTGTQVAGTTTGTFAYTDVSAVADGVQNYTTSLYVYIPAASDIDIILIFMRSNTGQNILVSDLPRDKWIRLTQTATPPDASPSTNNLFPGFVASITGADSTANSIMYHAYHTMYLGYDYGVPCGNSILSQVSDKRISWEGAWLEHPYTAGDYTADTGTNTTASGDVITYRYRIKDNTMTLNVSLRDFTLGSNCARVNIVIPESRLAKDENITSGICYPAASTQSECTVITVANSNQIQIYADVFSATGWTAGDRSLFFSLTFELLA